MRAVSALVVSPRPLPAARLGRSSRSAGGALAVAAVVLAQVAIGGWATALVAAGLLGLRLVRGLPRVERFRRCSRCGLVRDEDRARAGRPMRTCAGWIGEPYNRCMSAQYRLG